MSGSFDLQNQFKGHKRLYVSVIFLGFTFNYILFLLYAEWGEMQNITTPRERVELKALEKFTNYSVQVLAYTQAGDGVRSSVLYLQTKEDSK